MKKTIKSAIKKLVFFLFAISAFVSCEKDLSDNSQEGKLMDGKVNLLDSERYGCAEFSPNYLKSSILLLQTDIEHNYLYCVLI